MNSPAISAVDPYPRKRIAVLDTDMSYVEVGEGDPIVLLHGNPTSLYVWRNVIPYLTSYGRCLAPDLIGMANRGSPHPGHTALSTMRGTWTRGSRCWA